MIDQLYASKTDAFEAGKATGAGKLAGEILLMRVVLGLSPIHDLVKAVQVLHDEGREAFEQLRGPRSECSHEWKPKT